MELVSVCIPTYNGEKYLRECLNCVITQSYWNIEILIVDDQSVDATIDIAQEFAQYDDRIKIIINEENLGLVGNWNKCIKEASGEWIKFCFQDDYLHPDCIQEMLKFANNNNSRLCITQRNFIIEANAAPNIRDYFQNHVKKLEHFINKFCYLPPTEIEPILNQNLLENIIGEPTVMLFKKDLVTQYGYYNEDISQVVDYEFVYRIAVNEGLCFMPYPFAYFRIHGSAESNENRSSSRSREKFLKVEYIDDILLLKIQYDHLENKNAAFSRDRINDRLQQVFNFFINEQGENTVLKSLEPYFEKYIGLDQIATNAIQIFNSQFNQNINILDFKKSNTTDSFNYEVEKICGEIFEDDHIFLANNEVLEIEGWVTDMKSNPIEGVYAKFNNTTNIVNLLYGSERPDINNNNFIESKIGFSARLIIPEEMPDYLEIYFIGSSNQNIFYETINIYINNTANEDTKVKANKLVSV